MITKILSGALLFITLAFGAYFWYAQSEMQQQAKLITAKDIKIDALNTQITSLENNVKRIQAVNDTLTDTERDAADSAARLSDALKGIGQIAKEKPQIVQDMVNEAAQRRIRCFELATGAKPQKNEINKTCQHLIK